MSVTDRDRRIIMLLLPLALLAIFWFVLLSPKRGEAASLDAKIAKVEQKRDEQVRLATELEAASTNFNTEYASIVKLGKAVPSDVDMPSLLVQLETAARGTGISFRRVTQGERAAPPASQPATEGSTAPGGDGDQPAAAGGEAAQSAPGQTAESAGEAVDSANQAEGANNELDSTTSTSAQTGGLPVGGGSTGTGTPAASSSGAAGLEAVPLELEFSGRFFDLASFFHRLKRFVEADGQQLRVSGRLITIDGFSFGVSKEQDAARGDLESTITATVWLVPQSEGVAAGATPQGPGQSVPAATPTEPVAAPPAAVVTP